ncbi:PREDICTED: solute carrier organic anion transporter family member 5A1-like [Priapulus caudatus]|uniref:Solute carrier organic anion transporter family member 5A1-like n=1 Tax=Priapulus caudatus TaxID=37621 RepID=A0ABM1E5C3_PRICU|nr:PREDICTED: solute carrier organic anion transporter family member 5A1-like [Priapulus caudatus]
MAEASIRSHRRSLTLSLTHSYELWQDCNTDCGCNVEKYAPVCASNGVTYFSPCQAGCSDAYTLGDAKNFTGCSCTPDGVATAGKCDRTCTGAMVAYFILLGVAGLLVAPANVASFSLKIRVVEPKDKAMALGLGSFLLSGLSECFIMIHVSLSLRIYYTR